MRLKTQVAQGQQLCTCMRAGTCGERLRGHHSRRDHRWKEEDTEAARARLCAGMDVDGEAEDTAPRPNLREGTATPEGDRTSSEEPEVCAHLHECTRVPGGGEKVTCGGPHECRTGPS